MVHRFQVAADEGWLHQDWHRENNLMWSIRVPNQQHWDEDLHSDRNDEAFGVVVDEWPWRNLKSALLEDKAEAQEDHPVSDNIESPQLWFGDLLSLSIILEGHVVDRDILFRSLWVPINLERRLPVHALTAAWILWRPLLFLLVLDRRLWRLLWSPLDAVHFDGLKLWVVVLVFITNARILAFFHSETRALIGYQVTGITLCHFGQRGVDLPADIVNVSASAVDLALLARACFTCVSKHILVRLEHIAVHRWSGINQLHINRRARQRLFFWLLVHHLVLKITAQLDIEAFRIGRHKVGVAHVTGKSLHVIIIEGNLWAKSFLRVCLLTHFIINYNLPLNLYSYMINKRRTFWLTQFLNK